MLTSECLSWSNMLSARKFLSRPGSLCAAGSLVSLLVRPTLSSPSPQLVARSAACDARMSVQDFKTAQDFIDYVNTEYEKVHRTFEEQFWGTKMGLPNGTPLADGKTPKEYSVEQLTRTKQEMENFLADEQKLEQSRKWLQDSGLNAEQAKVLKLFERTFGCYIMESEQARIYREEATKLEGSLNDKRNKMSLGANMPGKGFVEMSSVGLREKLRTAESEEERKACYEGLTGIGSFVLSNGFIEIVKLRNKMAKALGYVDYYDYKVRQAEGFSKDRLFEILDTLEKGTRDLMLQARAKLASDKGEMALKPWNMVYCMSGDVVKKLDPYFPFEKSVERWGRRFVQHRSMTLAVSYFSISFSRLGIQYRGAIMDLGRSSILSCSLTLTAPSFPSDLLDRKGKYSNGFCHWPQVGSDSSLLLSGADAKVKPAWRKPDGSWQPALTHFTSLANPRSVGSGHTALTTLMVREVRQEEEGEMRRGRLRQRCAQRDGGGDEVGDVEVGRDGEEDGILTRAARGRACGSLRQHPAGESADLPGKKAFPPAV
eukprot:768248-Hanusia_phi.AAC.5